jgi:O-antigen/teichoic acid export membrane protein
MIMGVAGIRIATLPLSLLCGVLSVRIMVGEIGPGDYGLVSLMLGTQLLLYFMDLGTGAGVLTGAATYRENSDERAVAPALWTALKVTSVSSILALTGSAILSAGGVWPTLLGRPEDDRLHWAITCVLLINVLVRPLVVVSTFLIGMGQAQLVLLLQLLVPVLALGVVAASATLDASILLYGSSLILGQLGFVLACLAVAVLKYDLVQLCRAGRRGTRARIPGARSYASSMLTINVVASVSIGFDRVIVSHLADSSALASYALAAQLYQPVVSIIQAVQQALWAELVSARTAPLPGGVRASSRLVALTLGAGVAGGVAFGILLGPVSGLISDGEIQVSWTLRLAFACLAVVQVGLIVPGAALTTGQGLRFQAVFSVVGVCLNLTASLLLTERVGAAGPVMGSALGALIQFLACGAYLRAGRGRGEF